MTDEDDEVQAAELARLESLIELNITQDDERGLALIPARIVAEAMEALDPERISHPALYSYCVINFLRCEPLATGGEDTKVIVLSGMR